MVNGPVDPIGEAVVRTQELKERGLLLTAFVKRERWAVSGGCGRELLLLIVLKRNRAFRIALVEKQDKSACEWSVPSSPGALFI